MIRAKDIRPPVYVTMAKHAPYVAHPKQSRAWTARTAPP